jgi:hypothetical protein
VPSGKKGLNSRSPTGRPVNKLVAFELGEVYLILKRASPSRPSGEWNDDDYDVICNGVAVGRIMKVHAAPVGLAVDVDAGLWLS